VRRFEGSRLHPVISDKGVRRFKPEDVERLAAALAAEQNTPSRIEKAAIRASELPKGELAALVFERLEQRHSLAEIVIALRVPPDEVRELYHSWLVGLWAGELQRPEPALPMRRTEQDVVRRVTCEQLASMLAALPEKQPTRISLARGLGEYIIADDKDESSTSFVEYRISPSWEGSSCRGRPPFRRSRGALVRASTVSPHTGSTFRGCGGRCL
jgi:hypothetical protein